MQLKLVSIIPCGGTFLLSMSPSTISIIPSIHHKYPKHPMNPKLPYTPISMVPSLVSTHFDLCGLAFSHRPDEVASVWRLRKLVFNKLIDLLGFSIQEIL